MRIVLETKRLLFRDHEPYREMEADPEVRRHVGGSPRPRSQAQERFREIYLPPAPDRLALWATVYKPEGRYIGYCGVYPHFEAGGNPTAGEGVLAFYLSRSYWGRDLTTEAGEAFLDFGFRELGLSRIVALVQVGNHASVRVMEELGMRPTGLQKVGQRSFHGYEVSLPDRGRSDKHSAPVARGKSEAASQGAAPDGQCHGIKRVVTGQEGCHRSGAGRFRR